MCKKWKIRLLWLLPVIILLIAMGIYIGDYYKASDMALGSISNPANGIIVSEESNEMIVFEPKGTTTGLIFYPGGKVEYKAYAPLMEALAENGILCVLVHMPANLAVLDINAADGMQERFPQIEDWYIGGHSLGGAMAASYLSEHEETYEGLLLLASYSTEDFRDSGLRVLSIYGSEDQVLNADKYASNKENLPDDFEEVIIQGGNHAYFGSYGEQEGDGEPTISNETQIQVTVDAVLEFMD